MGKLKVGFIPIEGGHFYKDALEEVVRAEDLGFDSVWMEEHHSVVNHYWPSPLPVLAGFATRTSRVLLGTDILVAPFYHPVRLAEDAAMIDVMSAGRFVLGAAIGYKPDEFALYGAEPEKRIMVSYRREYAGGWKHPFIDASIATDLDSLMKQRFLIGGPDQVRKALEPFVSEYGLTHLICRLFFPGMAHRHIMRELELITKEVIPAFL